jgi:hypothetical protein
MKTNNKITLKNIMNVKEGRETMSELEKSVRKDIIAFATSKDNYLVNPKYWTVLYWKHRLGPTYIGWGM